MIVAPGSTSVSVDVQFLDDAGAARTGMVAADFPACKWSGGTNVASTAITLSDLAAITTAHPNDNTAGGVKEREGGWYRLDLPNNMLTSAGRKTLTFAETTNKRIVAPFVDCQATPTEVNAILGALTTSASAGDPGTTTTLTAYLKQIINTLEGSAGIPTFPAAAVAANNVSLAETIRSIDSRLPAALSSGNLKADVFAMQTDVISAASLSAAGVNKIRDALVIAALSPSINVGELGYTLASAAGFAANAAADAATTKTQTTAAAIAAAVWNALTSGLSTVGSIGKLLVDKLGSVSGQVASQTEVLAIQNNTNVRVDCPEVMERPDSGSVAYLLSLYIYDDAGNMESPDSTPTITAANQSGTDRSANLSSVTNVATGKYTATYTLSSGDSIEQIRFEWTIVEGSATRLHGRSAQVVDTTAVDFTNTDRSTLATIAADAATAATQATQSLKGTNPADPVENSLTGAVKIDWGNIDSPGATVDLPNTTLGLGSYGLDNVLIEAAIAASALLVNDTGTQLTSINGRQALSLILAAAAAKLSGAEGATIDLKPAGKPAAASRVTATCDVDGNRTPTTVRVPD